MSTRGNPDRANTAAAHTAPDGAGATVEPTGPGPLPAPGFRDRAEQPPTAQTPGRTPAQPPRAATVGRAVLIGLATGARSTAGATALVVTSSRADPAPFGRLAGLPVRIAACAATAAEVVLDTLPVAPPRTAPAGLVPRVLLAPLVAVGADVRDGARPDGPTVLLDALTAAAAATVAAFAGVRLRAFLARRLGADLPGALAEDALVGLLVRAGTRRAPGLRVAA